MPDHHQSGSKLENQDEITKIRIMKKVCYLIRADLNNSNRSNISGSSSGSGGGSGSGGATPGHIRSDDWLEDTPP